MSDTFAIMLSVVRRTADTWDDQAEQLRGGHKRLTDAKNAVDALGDRAGPVGATYLATWLEQLTTLAESAQSRSDGLRSFTSSVQYFDETAADELRALLPWDNQDAVRPTLANGLPDFPTDDPGPSPSPTPEPQP
jgi:hypothetical protein